MNSEGGVISLTLFNIMINDIFDNCEYTDFSLFADDGLLMIRAENLELGLEHRKYDLHAIENWSETWGLRFSVDKTKCIIFSKRPIHQPDTILYI